MRTIRPLALVGALALAVVAVPASPARAAAPPTFRFSSTGGTAEAFFSNYPADGNVVAGTVYTDRYVTGGDQATKADGTTSSGSFAYYDAFSYSFDHRGNFVFVSDDSGYAEGVSFSLDKKLTAASLSGTVEITHCTDKSACTDAGPLSLAVTWSGYGDVTRVKGTSSAKNHTLHYTDHFDGSYRNATATGFPDFSFGDVFRGSDTSRCVGTGC